MTQQSSITSYQELFIAQDKIWSTYSINVLTGIAIFTDNIDIAKLQKCLTRLVNESSWTRLEIDLDLNCWNVGNSLNGKFSLENVENIPISISTNLWQISLAINEENEWQLSVRMHHVLADAHSFQLFWKQLFHLYKDDYLFDWNIKPSMLELPKKSDITGIKKLPDVGLGKIKRLQFELTSIQDIEAFCIQHKISTSTLLLKTLIESLDELEQILEIPLQVGMALRNRFNKIQKETFQSAVNFLPLRHEHQLSDIELSVRNIFRQQSYPLISWLRETGNQRAFKILFSFQKEKYDHQIGVDVLANFEFKPPLFDENVMSLHILDYGNSSFKFQFDVRLDLAIESFWSEFVLNYKRRLRNYISNENQLISYSSAELKTENTQKHNLFELFDKAPNSNLALVSGEQSFTFGQLRKAVDDLGIESKQIHILESDRSVENIIYIIKAWKLGQIVTFHTVQLSNELEVNKYVYLAETSGSTGRHKQILIRKEGIESMLFSWNKELELTNGSIHLSTSDQKFDVFFGDLFRSVFSGNTLVLATESQRFNFLELNQLINKFGVTHYETVPSLLTAMLDYIPKMESLRYLICGSEKLTLDFYQKLKNSLPNGCKLFNSYGLTEVSIDSAFKECHVYDNMYIPLGFPLGDQHFKIVNSNGDTLPKGIWGELVISGNCVGQPLQMDVEKYSMEHDFLSYKTGDAAMIDPVEGLIVKGRLNTDFIKVNGKRIPSDLITLKLHELKLVDTAILSELNGQAILFFQGPYDKEVVKQKLKDFFLPSQLPDRYFFNTYWPLSLSGKLDVKLILESFKSSHVFEEKWSPSSDDNQKMLFDILQNMGLSFGSFEQDLFELGWTSIDVIRLCNELVVKGKVVSPQNFMKEISISYILKQVEGISKPTKTEEINDVTDENDMDDILSILNKD